MPGIILPNNAGAPNLPGNGSMIAIPQNSSVSYEIISSEKLVFDGEENYLLVAYNPNPGPNRIPPGISENYRYNF